MKTSKLQAKKKLSKKRMLKLKIGDFAPASMLKEPPHSTKIIHVGLITGLAFAEGDPLFAEQQ